MTPAQEIALQKKVADLEKRQIAFENFVQKKFKEIEAKMADDYRKTIREIDRLESRVSK
jgi:hypothetical protein